MLNFSAGAGCTVSRTHRPTQPGHPHVGKRNEYWQWYGKFWVVLGPVTRIIAQQTSPSMRKSSSDLEYTKPILLDADVVSEVAANLNKESQKCFRHHSITHADTVYTNRPKQLRTSF